MNDIMSSMAGYKVPGFEVYADGVLTCCGLIIPWYALILPFLNGNIYSVILYVESV